MSKFKETAAPAAEVVEKPVQAQVQIKLAVVITVGAGFLSDIEINTAYVRSTIQEMAEGLCGSLTSLDIS
jgi:hypothetical protein